MLEKEKKEKKEKKEEIRGSETKKQENKKQIGQAKSTHRHE